MLRIAKETWGKNGVEAIMLNNIKSLNARNIEEE